MADPNSAAAAPSPASSPPLTQVPSRAAPAAAAYITSVGLHPVEPLQVVGLSSGEVCLLTASTDALAWLVEMDAARQEQLCVQEATGIPASTDKRNGGSAGSAASAATALAPPEHPIKVFAFASLSASSAAAGGCAVLHCGFLRGQADDLLREVVEPRQPRLAAASASVARHLLYVVTNANDIFVVDVKSEVVVVRWNASTATHAGGSSSGGAAEKQGKPAGSSGSSAMSGASPLHAQFIVTQAETFGALLFLTVARRSAVQAAAAALVGRFGGAAGSDVGCGPERNAVDHCNEPAVYVLHWGCSQPFAAPSTKGLVTGGGAYVIKAVSQDKQKLRDPARAPAVSAAATAADQPRRGSLSIRAHPFAPLVLLLLNRTEVQVYALDGDERDVGPKKAQLILFHSPLSTASAKPPTRATPATPPAPLIDAQFVPSAAVLVRQAGHGSSSSSSSSSTGRRWTCRNVQVLLLSPTRLRLLCTRPASAGDAAGTVAADRVFYAAPEVGAALPSTSRHVRFLRAWTWLASPDTLFVLRSDRTLLEMSCNDFVAASMEVPSVRSRRLLPPRTVPNASSAAVAVAEVGEWWLLPPGSGGLPCAQCPDTLPLWGRGAVLSGVFAPRLPACTGDDAHTLVFSRLTGLARPLPIPQKISGDADDDNNDGGGGADVDTADAFHLSLVADTETISSRCVAIRLCLTPQSPAAPATDAAAASPNASTLPAQASGLHGESVNVGIARVLCDSAAPALCRLEHGFYFVGSREESAYADYPFLVAGLQYVDQVDASDTSVDSAAQLRVAMLCLPADRRALCRLYTTAKAGCGSGSGDGCGAFAPALSMSAELKRTLRQVVLHTQVQSLPMPQFDFEVAHASRMTKQLLSCAFQLSNDGVVPCVWSLWAPIFPYAATAAAGASADAAATMSGPLPSPQALQLTMQSFYVAAETQELRWRAPELVQMDDLLASNPSQVFALNSVLTTGGGGSGSGAGGLPPPYTSLDDVLTDVDAAVVARLFLYYPDRKVLVLATVETGSSREAGFDSEVIDDVYNFASRARNGRVMGGRLFTAPKGGAATAAAAEGRGEGRQYLRLVPHAAAEMNEWKGGNTAEALSSSLLSAVQLSAVLVNDHGEPALRIAVTSRRFGVALALFPLAGRRGMARVSSTLQPVKVYLYRRWTELMCVTAAVTQQAEESARQDAVAASPERRRPDTATGVRVEDVQHSPLLRRYRTWVDTVAHPSTTYAAVPLMQWVWPPAWPGVDGDAAEAGTGSGGDAGEEKKGMTHKQAAASSAAAANPILLLQRGRALYVLHHTGAAVQMCASLLHCSPLHLAPRATPHLTNTSAAPAPAPGALCLQLGSYPGLLARTRLLRQLQLQYGPYTLYTDATVSSQAPAAKVKWFKKFLKSANSSEAARRRVQERPRQVAWLERVFHPTPDDLSGVYGGALSRSGQAAVAMSPQVGAAFERLVGAGITHVGNVLDVDVSDPLRLSTLAVEALAASHGMQLLVSSAGMLTDTLRDTLRHLTTVLGPSSNSSDEAGARVGEDETPMSVMQGNWAVAEALARLPLGCVTGVMGQEVRRAAAAATAVLNASPVRGGGGGGGGGGGSDVRKRQRLAEVQRWWWLLMRSSALVTSVNAVETAVATRVVTAVFEELPLSSPLLQPPADEEAVTAAVSHALLLCSPRFLPEAVAHFLQSGTTATQQQVRRLTAAMKAALVVLGGEEATAAAAAATAGEVAKDAAAASWSSLFATVRMDGAHWTHAVYYTNLLTHLRHLAGDAEEAGEEGEEKKEANPIQALARRCLSGADAAVEATAAAVLDVATQTVGVLLGAVVDVPAAARSRMAQAVAQSMSKRQQVLQNTERTRQQPTPPSQPLADGGVAALTDVPVVDDDVYFLNQTPVDQLRHSLYAAQWRDLFDTFAYPTRYFFHSSVGDGGKTSNLPYQLQYDASMSGARGRDAARAGGATTATAAAAAAAAAAADAGASRHHRGRVQKVLMTEDPHSGAVVPPAMEIELVPSSQQLITAAGGRASTRNKQQQQQPQTPLSLRAAVAKEEADLHNTYFNGFAAHEPSTPAAGGATAAATDAAKNAAATSGVDNDSLARDFAAQLEAVGGAEGSASAVQRERRKAAERQHVPDAAAFAPSATRRAAAPTGGAAEAGENVYGDHLYGAVPSQQAFFARFQGDDA